MAEKPDWAKGELTNPPDWAKSPASSKSLVDQIPNEFATPGGLPPKPESMGNKVTGAIGKAWDESKLDGLGPTEAIMTEAGIPAAKMIGKGIGKVGESIGKALPVITEPLKKGAKSVKEAISDVFGTRIPAAKKEASEAAKKYVENAIASQSKAGMQDIIREKAITGLSKPLTKNIESARFVKMDLNQQGEELHKKFTDVMAVAKNVRASKADELFGKVKEVAAQKEALGQRIDKKELIKSVDDALAKAENIPELKSKLQAFKSSISTNQNGIATEFDQLEYARRYLNDIAHSSVMQGYDAIVKGEAGQLAKKIDEAMKGFVPEFGEYKDIYAKMSEPLESLNTRIGRAISGTEGGFQDTVYSKVAKSDLPTRIFSKKEGYDLMVDALAGGRSATPEARLASSKEVDGMLENWIRESTRLAKPSVALDKLSSPQMRPILSSAPHVETYLKKTFGDISGMDKTANQLVKIANDMKIRGSSAMESSNKMKIEMEAADAKSALPGKASQKAAYDGRIRALAEARKAGLIPKEQYDATLKLIDRAETLEDKSAQARKILGWIGLGAGGYEIGKFML